jgi:hypothetical protein
MALETPVDRLGVDATANNNIRAARPTARFFSQPAPGRSDSFQSNIVDAE